MTGQFLSCVPLFRFIAGCFGCRQGHRLLVLLLVLTACEPTEETREPAHAAVSPFRPGPLEIGHPGGDALFMVSSLPNSLNPYLGSEQSSQTVLTQLFIGLTRINALTGKMEPALAQSLTPSKDGLSWTIRLRPGLKWSDGQPLTARDVVFTYQDIIANPHIPNNYRDFWSYQKSFPQIEQLDDRTVRFQLSQPFAPFENNLVAPILPAHVLQDSVRPNAEGQVGFSSRWGIDARPEALVVNGPWQLARFEPGARVRLKPNPHYFETDARGQRLPYLQSLTFLEAPDPNLALIKFAHGETDAYPLRPEDYDQLAPWQGSRNFTIYNLGPSPAQLFVTFNQSSARRADGKPLIESFKSAWFRDLRFRRALALAIDKRALITSVYQGRALSQYSHLSPLNPYYNYQLQDYPHDLATARRLLRQAGFRLRADGLYDAAGRRVRFELTTNSSSAERDAICAQLRAQWSQLGIAIDYRPRPFNLISRQIHERHDWEALVFGLAGSPIEPHFSASRWKRTGRMHLFNMGSGPAWNGKSTDFSSWEQTMETLYTRAAGTTDPLRRRALYAEAQRIERREMPFIYLVSELNLLAVSNRLGNVRPSAYGGSGLQQLNWGSQYLWQK